MGNLERLVGVESILTCAQSIHFECNGLRVHENLLNVLVLELEDCLLGGRGQQIEALHFYGQPHVVGHLDPLVGQLLEGLLVRLDIEQVGSENYVTFYLVYHNLTA